MKTRKVDVKITNPDGSIVFKQEGFEVPDGWSDRAAGVVCNKYAADGENSAIDIIDRVVDQITEWGEEQGYFRNQDNTDNDTSIISKFSNDLKDILIDQRAAFNSPVYFNAGTDSGSNQCSACFIFTVEDNMEDILDHVKREGMVFKSGSGAGINISKLRAKGEKLSNKGESSGIISFMKIYDVNAGSIKSGGKNRRSAKLVCLDVDHPDIMEFIECKKLEEEKIKILKEGGISSEEAQSTVAFQNANHSIRVSDKFMKAVQNNENWELINRGDGKVSSIIPAKDILRKAAECAWETGDPGIQFDDRMNKDNPVPLSGRIYSTNPCTEFSAIDNSSCNLASLNLVKYLKEDGGFDKVRFSEDIKVLITAMDIIIDAADYPTKEVRDTTLDTRPLGLGFTNLGAYLMLKGLPYGSEEARKEAAEITKFMTYSAYSQSIELARQLGSFNAFEDNLKTCVDICERLIDSDELSQGIIREGLRNSQLTLLAPTGTISFMMDCDSTGVEPLFALKTTKTLAGGGTIEIVPNCINLIADKLAAEGNDIGMNIEKGINNLPKEQKAIFKTANELSWKEHVDMLAAVQPHLNGAISKTSNLSSDATIEDVEDAYMYAWESGIKALAIYRDGSKDMQPLSATPQETATDPLSVSGQVSTNVEKAEKSEKGRGARVQDPVRRAMPKTRDSVTHKIDLPGFEGYITVGMYKDGRPGDIFIKASKEGSTIGGLLDSFAIAISFALQYRVPLEVLVRKFKDTRFEPSGWTGNSDIPVCSSVVDYIFKWMEKNFIVEDDHFFEKYDLETEEPPKNTPQDTQNKNYDGPPCINCGSLTQRSGSCFTCCSCGETTGCG
jgi:ribonucleoside-diphosphate reductase alpha chain